MNDEARDAVNTYVSGGSYVLNEKLRTDSPLTEAEEKIVKSLDRVVASLPKYDGEVSRSLFFYNGKAVEAFVSQFRKESQRTFKEYLSATKGGIYNPAGQVQIFIKSANGADFAEFNPLEQEVLYTRGSSIFVKKIDKIGDKYYIWLEELLNGK